MKAKSLVLSSLALATGAVFAQQSAAPLTRAEVAQQVLDARAHGTLRPAGAIAPEEAMRYNPQLGAHSTLTRAEKKDMVLQARAEGRLAHAGAMAPEEVMKYAHPSASTLSRADVKEQVLDARADGTLIPAGQEALVPSIYAHPTFATTRPGADETVASGSE